MLLMPIGFIRTCFKTKNGTPRQPSVSAVTKGVLVVEKSVFTNPDHSLDGLEEFSHVWILFHFHLNEGKSVKAKVRPPRLNGEKRGVFATRSPHRPNAIGLSLAKLDKVEGCTLHLSGLDIVDGTPIFDIKPYIPSYDAPVISKELLSSTKPTNCSDVQEQTVIDETIPEKGQNQSCNNVSHFPSWIVGADSAPLNVVFTARAEEDLESRKQHVPVTENNKQPLDGLVSSENLRRSIIDILAADPRSAYRRKKCCDRLYYFSIDGCHVTAWFDDTSSPVTAEVLRVKPENVISDMLAEANS